MKKNAVCFHCLHVIPHLQEEDSILACFAYPEGVPQEIRDGEDEHKTLRDDEVEPYTYTEFVDMNINVSEEDKESIALLYGQCSGCRHWDWEHDKCPAFDKIPYPFIRRVGHKKVFVGQNQSSVTFQSEKK